jgi:diacylglycerol kinase (ATP)
MRALLVFNPAARRRTAAPDDLEGASGILRDAGFALDRAETRLDHPTAADLARRAVDERYDACIVAGGDGTVGPAAAALVGSDVVLGVLPFGTIMNIARGLGLPFAPLEAARTIARRRVRGMDAGEVAGAVFFETAGVGFDAELYGAARHAERGSWLDAADRVRRWMTHGTHRLRVSVDGESHEHRAMQLLVMDSAYYGWSIPVAPDARMDDGLLDVVVFPRMGRRALIRAAFFAWRMHHLPARPVRYRGAAIRVECDEPLSVHADGRLVGTLPVEFRCRRAALRVYGP